MAGRLTLATAAAVVVLGMSGLGSTSESSSRPEPPPSPLAQVSDNPTRPIVVGSKPFAESFLLSEVFAQLLEARGFPVERVQPLGGTEIVFQATVRGEVDVYPEYTGTVLVGLLGEDPLPTSAATLQRVGGVLRANYGLRMLPPLGFNSIFAISVRPGMADSLGLSTLSDLAAVSEGLIGGVSPDFVERADGMPGLSEHYGLRPRAVRGLLQAVKYDALLAGEVDFIDAYGTDGRLDRYGLTVLDDDLGFFPWYDAAAVVSDGLQQEIPAAVSALTELSGLIDVGLMRRWNLAVEVDGEATASVAARALRELGLVDEGAGRIATVRDDSRSFVLYLWSERGDLWGHTLRHLWLVVISLAAGLLVAVPLGLALERTRRVAEGVIRGVGLLQTIPSIALLAFMLPVFGIGVMPAVAALFLYSLLPMVRNTYAGVRDADPVAVASAHALGMTSWQLLLHVRLPIAAPVIMAGVRTAAVINVGTATLAAFIGAGGLGDPIVTGLTLADTRMVLSGAVPAAVLALAVDTVLGRIERAVSPAGLG